MERVTRNNNLRFQGSDLVDGLDPLDPSLSVVRFDQVLVTVPIVDDVTRDDEVEVWHVNKRRVVRISVFDIMDLDELSIVQKDFVGFGKRFEIDSPLGQAVTRRSRGERHLPQALVEFRCILRLDPRDDVAARHGLNPRKVFLQHREAEEVVAVRVRGQKQLQGTACGQCALDPHSQVSCGCDSGWTVNYYR